MNASQLYDHLDETRNALLREFGSALAIHEKAPQLLLLMDDLDNAVFGARSVPLTNDVRFRREDLRRILDAMREATP